MRSVLLDLLPHLLDTLKREPALAITLVYLFVAMAGIFYNYSFYRQFGIPVLSLSQISDFLVAGIQQPTAIVLVLSTLPLCWVFDRINAANRRRHARALQKLRDTAADSWYARLRMGLHSWRVNQQWFTYVGFLALVAVYSWIFVRIYAHYRVRAVRAGDATTVAVWLSGEGDALKAHSGNRWTYLGAIANYVFIYDTAAGRAVILPVDAIARIEPLLGAPAPGEPGALAPKP